MKFSRPKADLYVPDNAPPPEAVRRTTHLGIGAHQDDLEFMALHGILECYGRRDRWFGGVTCTDGAGSARSGPFAHYTDEQMMAVRVEEQRAAARIGQYGFMAQLGHPSSAVKEAEARESLVAELVGLLGESRPQVVYTHNPFDKHSTHIAVLKAVLSAIRRLPLSGRPQQLLGCEVWRGLDWLPDPLKVVHDVSRRPELAVELAGVFQSQIAGGKRYDLAVAGRYLANATFLDSHATDAATRVSYAVDLTPLIGEEGASLMVFADSVLEAFSAGIRDGL